jgi:hypothetical protein
MAKNPPLPLWGSAAKQTNGGERGRPAQKPECQPLQTPPPPTTGDGPTKTTGPPIFGPSEARALARP